MAQITTTFDTQEKTLEVAMDGKKIKNVREVVFYKYKDQATVEITTLDDMSDEDIITITKVRANESGDDEISTEHKNNITTKIAQALFPRKNIKGV